MTKQKLLACTKKELVEMVRKKGIAGWRAMSKDELVSALSEPASSDSSPRTATQRKRNHLRTQVAAARNTSVGSAAEEQVERSKYDVGVPTKDLSGQGAQGLARPATARIASLSWCAIRTGCTATGN